MSHTPDLRRDKAIELARYDQRANAVLTTGGLQLLGADGAAGLPAELRAPYLVYEAHLRQHARSGVHVLELCSGNGQHSLVPAREGARVTITDIAPNNVALTLVRAQSAGLSLEGLVADAENLPFPPATFDVVAVAGSLSYVDLDLLLAQVTRVLKPGGAFIFVDSLNHNPVYRLNRWLNYRRGLRSRSVLRRIPTQATLARIKQDFPDLAVSFHGIFAFLVPLLRPFGAARAARWLDRADHWFSRCGPLAFKVVGCGHRPAKYFP
jgi:ubiquinone/menaquinone biosynthesis C-methylase UbiE